MSLSNPWEVRTGKADHACIYIEGTQHNIAVGMKLEDAEDIVRRHNEAIKPFGCYRDARKEETQAILTRYQWMREGDYTYEQWCAIYRESVSGVVHGLIEDAFDAAVDRQMGEGR